MLANFHHGGTETRSRGSHLRLVIPSGARNLQLTSLALPGQQIPRSFSPLGRGCEGLGMTMTRCSDGSGNERVGEIAMRVGLFVCLIVVAALSLSAMLAWPSWRTTLIFLAVFLLCFRFGVRPKPFWWFPAASLLLVAAANLLFNRLVTPTQPGTLISPLGYVAGAALSLMVDYRGRQRS